MKPKFVTRWIYALNSRNSGYWVTPLFEHYRVAVHCRKLDREALGQDAVGPLMQVDVPTEGKAVKK